MGCKYISGTERIKRGFLFFPNYAKGEIRWFKYAYWKEIWFNSYDFNFWLISEWLTREEYIKLKEKINCKSIFSKLFSRT